MYAQGVISKAEWEKSMKMFSGLMLAVSVILACSAIPSVSYAQSTEDCLCLVPDRRDGQPIGTVLEAIGQVQVSQAAGFDPAAAGTSLNRGDRIIVGPQSNALISILPDCRRVIPANTDVVLDPVEPNICVRLSDASRGATATAAQKVGRAVIGGVVITGWVDILTSTSP